MQILGTIFNIIFIIASVLLILLILMQSGRSSGMGLFGGSGSQSAFGANSADVLTKTTAVLVVIFMLTGFGMAFIKKQDSSYKKIQEKITEETGVETEKTTDEAGMGETPAPVTEEAQPATSNQK